MQSEYVHVCTVTVWVTVIIKVFIKHKILSVARDYSKHIHAPRWHKYTLCIVRMRVCASVLSLSVGMLSVLHVCVVTCVRCYMFSVYVLNQARPPPPTHTHTHCH